MHSKTVVEVGADGVAVVAINNPPLNLLSVEVMLSLKESIEGVLPRDDVKAIVITGKNRTFSAGFDVSVFGGEQKKRSKIDSIRAFLLKDFIVLLISSDMYKAVTAREELGFLSIQFITKTLEAARKPFVAAIDGHAFGGALEIGLACHARISTSSAKLGLTELKYGVIPGLGGTQRLPRLVGIRNAVRMLLMSTVVDGKEAQILSLVDAIAPADKLLDVARQWALDIVEGTRPWVISLYKTDKLGTVKEARATLDYARRVVQTRNPNVEHPLVCIDLIEQGIVSDPHDALWNETTFLHELRQSSTCKSLVHFFFAQRETTKAIHISEISDNNLLPRNIAKVAVIGGGFMSSEIVALLVLRNCQVILKEKNREHLLEEINKIRKNLHTHFKHVKTVPQGIEKALSLLKGVLDYDSFEDVDLVIEAECETLSIKQDIFADLEKLCPPNCILATSSSAFSLELIGERTKCQDRIVGVHFFSRMLLMEIVRTERMAPQATVDVIAFATKLNRNPVVVRDCNGQGVSSMVVTHLHAATLLAELGVDVYQIDQALTRFGMYFGPFRMIDMFGIKAFAEISRILVERLPDRFYKSKLIPILQNANREGESTKGFYKYDNSGNASPDPELSHYTFKARAVGKLTAESEAQLRKLSDTEIVEMILFPAVNEACRVISERVVLRPSDIDVASVSAMGFPNYRGGIHYWSNSFDSGYVYSKLKKWSEAYGDFFEPCDYVAELSGESTPVANQRKKQIKSQL